ncbi:hypothetical protein HELRODRAFT_163690 [Helobdella robusta]|uniref:G-protein coupled receptors family 2 profile 2 domain-containing protein n=1 Tax=Helobdella robusta TaxID=6412 RepID=T1EUC9_HELRO|nr:hypothetical protein HELRODRAFT_163690 [Helobdella robusta]ESN96605.1 hypothetical protein HELRODRAFT_163690 [Helobdella robusta]
MDWFAVDRPLVNMVKCLTNYNDDRMSREMRSSLKSDNVNSLITGLSRCDDGWVKDWDSIMCFKAMDNVVTHDVAVHECSRYKGGQLATYQLLLKSKLVDGIDSGEYFISTFGTQEKEFKTSSGQNVYREQFVPSTEYEKFPCRSFDDIPASSPLKRSLNNYFEIVRFDYPESYYEDLAKSYLISRTLRYGLSQGLHVCHPQKYDQSRSYKLIHYNEALVKFTDIKTDYLYTTINYSGSLAWTDAYPFMTFDYIKDWISNPHIQIWMSWLNSSDAYLEKIIKIKKKLKDKYVKVRSSEGCYKEIISQGSDNFLFNAGVWFDFASSDISCLTRGLPPKAEAVCGGDFNDGYRWHLKKVWDCTSVNLNEAGESSDLTKSFSDILRNEIAKTMVTIIDELLSSPVEIFKKAQEQTGAPLSKICQILHACVFAKYENGQMEWSTDGLETIDSNVDDSYIECESFQKGLHLKEVGNALQWVSVMGIVISIVCLSLVIIGQIIFKKFCNGQYHIALLNLSISLICVNLIIMFGLDKKPSSPPLSSSSSLLPAVVVNVTGFIDYRLFDGFEHHCWLAKKAFYFAFLLPLGLIILVNIFVFVRVIKGISCDRPTGMVTNQLQCKLIWLKVQVALCTFFIMGLTWSFAFLAYGDASVVMYFLFAIFNSLQGIFIFLLFNLREKPVRCAWGSFVRKPARYLPFSATSTGTATNSNKFTPKKLSDEEKMKALIRELDLLNATSSDQTLDDSKRNKLKKRFDCDGNSEEQVETFSKSN